MYNTIQQLKQRPSTYVVVLLLLVSVPHFEYIPWWSVTSVLILSIWRLAVTAKSLPPPHRYLTMVITIFFSAVVYQYSGGFSGISAGSHLLIIMSFCKLLESKNYRDYMLLIILSFFIISTNFLFTQTIGTAIYMIFCLYAAIFCLITINQPENNITLKSRSMLSFKMIVYALPVMLVLFVFFPRINGPLWKTADETQRAKTGLSETMEPGQISQLIQSNELAFRVRFNKKIPANNQLYWRAIILWQYDGHRWTKGSSDEEDTTIEIPEPGFEYTVTLEPHQKKWLFLLDLPYSINQPYRLATDFTAQSSRKINKHIQYRAASSTQFTINQNLSSNNQSLALALPGKNPLAKRLAQRWHSESNSAEDIVNKAKSFFRNESFYYTLTPPQLTRNDAVDQFLFETRRGFCEHYANAFAVLMRHANIPSRVVLGYQGGKFNPFTTEFAVNQSMAHAWTEVWLAGKGWTRVDPTAEIAPERVEQNLASALRDQANIPLHLSLNFPALEKLRQLFDAIDSHWNQWVISYNEKTQQQFLKFLTGENLNLKEIGSLFLKVLLTTLIIISIFYFLSARQPALDPAAKAYRKLLKKFARAGIVKALHEGPRDFQARLIQHLPAQKNQINELFDLYVEEKYRRSGSDQAATQFISAARRFKVKKKLVVN